jgi:hypothetical protein
MSLEVMVSVETLRTLIALERSVVGWTLPMPRMWWMTSIHLLHVRYVAAVET